MYQHGAEKGQFATMVPTLVKLVAVLVFLSWVWVNAYHFYPMLAAGYERTAGRIRRTSEREPAARYSDGGRPAFDASTGNRPSFDVLLPAYEEGTVIEHSIASIRDADYDQDLITVSVLVEPDDGETRAALASIDEEYEFEELVVPADYPGDPNKPRALDYGFERTDADVVTILDAEDVVDPELYRRIVEKLAAGCDYVQGRLDMANEEDGWMNTMFRAEYGYWYKVNTLAKYHRDYPIPLGGTTCFFPRSVLEEISDRRRSKYGSPWDEEDRAWLADNGFAGHVPWDPTNVTEDFELGLFLWQEGYRAGYVESTPTNEESPLTLDAWMRQRTRWKKGKLYTFLHYLRHPPDGVSAKAHIYTQSAVPHLGPVNLTSVVVLLLGANLLGYTFGPALETVLTVAFGFTLGMIGLYSYGYWTTSDRSRPTRARRTVVVALSLLVYWLMQWLADMRAIRQTYRGQFHWAKTRHFGRHLGTLSEEVQTAGEATRLTLPGRVRFTLLSGALLTGAATRLHGLASWSLWGDELFSVVSRADQPLAELVTFPLSIDPHPPLYYVLLHFWMEGFGNSVASVRLLSVVFSVAAIGLLFRLGTELFDDRVGLLAALLFALSPFHVHYGRMARMYSLFALLTIASWYGFVRLRDESPGTTVGYVVATVLLLYTHAYGLFVLAAQYLYVGLSDDSAGLNLRKWVIVQAVVSLLSILWIATVMLRVIGLLTGDVGRRNVIGHLPTPTLGTVKHTLIRFSGLPSNYPIVADSAVARAIAVAVAFLFVCVLVFAWMRYTPDGRYEFTTLGSASQLSLLLLVPVLVPIALSHIVVPVYATRFALPASIALLLLVARGISNVGNRNLRFAVIAVVLAGSTLTSGAYYDGESVEDWRGGAACVEDNVEPDDAVLYQPFWIQERMEYYDDGSNGDRHRALPSSEIATRSVPHALNVDGVRDLARRYDVIWVVREGLDDPTHVLDELDRTHEQVYADTDDVPNVYRYVNASSANESGRTVTSACERSGASPSSGSAVNSDA